MQCVRCKRNIHVDDCAKKRRRNPTVECHDCTAIRRSLVAAVASNMQKGAKYTLRKPMIGTAGQYAHNIVNEQRKKERAARWKSSFFGEEKP